jgi:phosphatidylserine/phosphatidylglycerophosphate/cardiolipin synthase-like enzyme
MAIAHNKVMVIDSRTVITGSFNFTKAAEESNAENLLVIDDAELAKKYTQNWTECLDPVH